jgi:hypothetical protein
MFTLSTVKTLAYDIMSSYWVFLMCIGLHFVLPRIYIYACIPFTFVGILLSPFMAQSPHCKAIMWALNTSIDTIQKMFLLLVAWLLSRSFMKSINTKKED